jgi:hypothetical protein
MAVIASGDERGTHEQATVHIEVEDQVVSDLERLPLLIELDGLLGECCPAHHVGSGSDVTGLAGANIGAFHLSVDPCGSGVISTFTIPCFPCHFGVSLSVVLRIDFCAVIGSSTQVVEGLMSSFTGD